MKRIIAIFLVVLLLTGCGAQPEESAVPSTVPATTETVETTEASETVPEETEPPVIYAQILYASKNGKSPYYFSRYLRRFRTFIIPCEGICFK